MAFTDLPLRSILIDHSSAIYHNKVISSIKQKRNCQNDLTQYTRHASAFHIDKLGWKQARSSVSTHATITAEAATTPKRRMHDAVYEQQAVQTSKTDQRDMLFLKWYKASSTKNMWKPTSTSCAASKFVLRFEYSSGQHASRLKKLQQQYT